MTAIRLQNDSHKTFFSRPLKPAPLRPAQTCGAPQSTSHESRLLSTRAIRVASGQSRVASRKSPAFLLRIPDLLVCCEIASCRGARARRPPIPRFTKRRKNMPDSEEREVMERARRDREEGKSPSTQAGEFVREEMHHIREGKHGAASPQQAIAIGLSKARRAGVPLPAPKRGKTSARTRHQAPRELRKGRSSRRHKPSRTRSRAITRALRRKGHSAASRASLGQHARAAARRRGARSLHGAAMKAVHTKGHAGLRQAARKAARTRARHRKAA
jgi:hypothetical protein